MTREEVLAMKPGRELDALVMRTVFKAEKKDIGDECYWVSEVNGEEVCWPRCFSPSLDISDAWEVVGEMQSNEWDFTLKNHKRKYEAIFGTLYNAFASTASEAICKAALLAVMGKWR